MTEKEFLKQIRGIDIALWKSQVATVVNMQKTWLSGFTAYLNRKEKAEELDGLVEVLGIITDYIDPIKTEEE